MAYTTCNTCKHKIRRIPEHLCSECLDYACSDCLIKTKCKQCIKKLEDRLNGKTKRKLNKYQRDARSEVINELLMIFNDYETPILMSAEDVRTILIKYSNEKL